MRRCPFCGTGIVLGRKCHNCKYDPQGPLGDTTTDMTEYLLRRQE